MYLCAFLMKCGHFHKDEFFIPLLKTTIQGTNIEIFLFSEVNIDKSTKSPNTIVLCYYIYNEFLFDLFYKQSNMVIL